jgi:hypothetical protein
MKNDGTWLYILERVKWSGERNPLCGGNIAYFWEWDQSNEKWLYSDFGSVSDDGTPYDFYGFDGNRWYYDTDAGGHNNVKGAASYDGAYYWFEFRKQLNSGDGYDWAFAPGGTYGYPRPPDLTQVGFWDQIETTFYGKVVALHLSAPD